MAKSEDKPSCEPEHIDNTLDAVLISALQENFEIKNGYHLDRSEMLEFLRSVIKEHPDLNFVLKYRDTKLSGRIYKAFPKVTTKRVAVPNIRGKKIWTYTNLRRINSNQKGSQPKEDAKLRKSQTTRAVRSESKQTLDSSAPSIMPRTRRERKPFKSKRNVHSASMVQRDSLFESYKRDREGISFSKSSRHVGNVPQQSYLGRFNDMLKWVKEHFVLDKNSSVQVKQIVESIKTEFKINITYKQSHKLIFAVFPGTTTRVQDPVKIEAQGGFYSYRGITLKPKKGRGEEEPPFAELHHSPPKPSDPQNVQNSFSPRQTWFPPCVSSENGQKRIMRTRKRFIEACAVLKPAEDALVSPANYDVTPIPSDVAPLVSEVQHKSLAVSSRFPDVGARFSDVSPMVPDVSPMASDMATIERENNWRRMLDELKQERDQAIVERNQAMVSLMEIERDQPTSARTPDDFPRHQATCSDVVSSATRLPPKIEERGRENPDWLQSLVNRSNIILGEQLSEANAAYFPGSTLQRSNYNQRYPKQAGYTSEFLEIERYEQLKRERDAIWQNWMDKMKAEKDDVIQQLKLDKMEVIQRMELEKSDVVESVEEKLTNQITILTREMRELKELLNHTMNERTLAIEHAHKLKELVNVEKLKEAGLESFPFDVTNDHVVHPPKQKTADEIASQKPLACLGKGNKRKQSMPAKLKKFPRLDTSVSTESEKYVDNVLRNESQTISTECEDLYTETESRHGGANIDIGDTVVNDNGSTSETGSTSGVIDVAATDTGAADYTEETNIGATELGATDLLVVPISSGTCSDKVLPDCDAKTAHSIPHKKCPTPFAESSTISCPFSTQPRSDWAEKLTIAEQRISESSTNDLDSGTLSSTEISKKLQSRAKDDSNIEISEKSDNSLVASNSEKDGDETTMVKAEAIDSRNEIDIPVTVCSDTNSRCGKIPSEIPRSVNASVNASVNSYRANSNFQKYFDELPKTLPGPPSNAEIQKFSPGIPRTISASSDSQLLSHGSPRSFEESVNSTFLKYFPELPKSSFNSPLTAESSKYFRGTSSRNVSSSGSSVSEKYVADPGNRALVYHGEESFSKKNKVSSIDFLNSMVENIGKSLVE